MNDFYSKKNAIPKWIDDALTYAGVTLTTHLPFTTEAEVQE